MISPAGDIRLFLELCPNGSLETYLRENRSTYGLEMREINLIRWSYQIAAGMQYLAFKNVSKYVISLVRSLWFVQYVQPNKGFGTPLINSLEYVYDRFCMGT